MDEGKLVCYSRCGTRLARLGAVLWRSKTFFSFSNTPPIILITNKYRDELPINYFS